MDGNIDRHEVYARFMWIVAQMPIYIKDLDIHRNVFLPICLKQELESAELLCRDNVDLGKRNHESVSSSHTQLNLAII